MAITIALSAEKMSSPQTIVRMPTTSSHGMRGDLPGQPFVPDLNEYGTSPERVDQ